MLSEAIQGAVGGALLGVVAGVFVGCFRGCCAVRGCFFILSGFLLMCVCVKKLFALLLIKV